jgi:hypothetical protein
VTIEEGLRRLGDAWHREQSARAMASRSD